MSPFLTKTKNSLEEVSYRYRLLKRKIIVRNKRFSVYAWHSKTWHLPDDPPLCWMLDNTKTSDVVYDIGAYRGYLTLALAIHLPDTRIIAFEPNPDEFEKLLANLSLNKYITSHIKVFRCALGDRSGLNKFFIANVDGASSFNLEHVQRFGHGLHTEIEVEMQTLDNLVFKKTIPAPNHIKIDTEGFEVPILRGAEETIKKYRPFIYAEIHETEDHTDNENEIRDFMNQFQYRTKQSKNQLFCVPK